VFSAGILAKPANPHCKSMLHKGLEILPGLERALGGKMTEPTLQVPVGSTLQEFGCFGAQLNHSTRRRQASLAAACHNNRRRNPPPLFRNPAPCTSSSAPSGTPCRPR